MAKLTDLLTDLGKRGAPEFAGYVKGGEFLYWTTDNASLPAAAYVVDQLGKDRNTTVYSSIPPTHWILTYLRKQIRHPQAKGTRIPSVDVTARKLADPALKVFGGFRKLAPPLTSGLYAAAAGMAPGKTLTGEAKGLERCLRYYMLATYALLGLCKHMGYNGGNFVAALMVSDTGEILSYGVNSGSYHHAEVNMLLSYFSRNPTDTKFPSKTIVFSSLTPCEQCTGYLVATKPADCVIYFGQEDTGSYGSAGKSISKAISDETKPVHVAPLARSTVKKAEIDKRMASCVDANKPNIAKQIGDSANAEQYLKAAVEEIHHKVTKSRGAASDPTEAAEQAVKEKVLLYITEFLITVDIPA
jgi:tRNA(Arg) A34 adenosine deaminase TadA